MKREDLQGSESGLTLKMTDVMAVQSPSKDGRPSTPYVTAIHANQPHESSPNLRGFVPIR
jgi:hypothetical protein